MEMHTEESRISLQEADKEWKYPGCEQLLSQRPMQALSQTHRPAPIALLFLGTLACSPVPRAGEQVQP